MKRQSTFRRPTNSFEGPATTQERLTRIPLRNRKEISIWMTAPLQLCGKMCHRIPLSTTRPSHTLPSRQEAPCPSRRSIPQEKNLSLCTIEHFHTLLTVICVVFSFPETQNSPREQNLKEMLLPQRRKKRSRRRNRRRFVRLLGLIEFSGILPESSYISCCTGALPPSRFRITNQ